MACCRGIAPRGLAEPLHFGPQGLVLPVHHRPVEHVPRPPAARLPHSLPEPGIADQIAETLDQHPLVDRHRLACQSAIGVVCVDAGFVSPGERLAVGRQHPGGNAETVHSVAHGVLVAVPVGDHDGQPGGHRLDRREAEGLLDVVRQRHEQIGRCPGLAATIRVLAIGEQRPHVGAGPRGTVGERLLDVLGGEPAGTGSAPASCRCAVRLPGGRRTSHGDVPWHGRTAARRTTPRPRPRLCRVPPGQLPAHAVRTRNRRSARRVG